MANDEKAFSGKRALLVADFRPAWIELASALQQDGMALEMVGKETLSRAAAECAGRDDTVAIVDFWGDTHRGLAALSTFRRLAPRLPVVAVVQNPPVDLVRRVRQSGVFFMALDPLGASELRTVLRDAFLSIRGGQVQPTEVRAKPKVLIIDDDPDFRASTQALLESEGYAVSCASDGKEGVAKVKALSPDLIVLDVMMEYDSAGYEVNWAVKYGEELEGQHHVPILMCSSVPIDPASRFDMAAEAPLVTPDRYLTKPLEIPLFLESVRTLLGAGA